MKDKKMAKQKLTNINYVLVSLCTSWYSETEGGQIRNYLKRNIRTIQAQKKLS